MNHHPPLCSSVSSSLSSLIISISTVKCLLLVWKPDLAYLSHVYRDRHNVISESNVTCSVPTQFYLRYRTFTQSHHKVQCIYHVNKEIIPPMIRESQTRFFFLIIYSISKQHRCISATFWREREEINTLY